MFFPSGNTVEVFGRCDDCSGGQIGGNLQAFVSVAVLKRRIGKYKVGFR